MSAWYIFSALGFYPVAPGSGEYALGSPLVRSAVIRLENGNTLTIQANRQSAENIYVQQVTLNGKLLAGNTIKHSDLLKGGTLVFEMGAKPKR
jgi:putative alpha-1,2-mannosidase